MRLNDWKRKAMEYEDIDREAQRQAEEAMEHATDEPRHWAVFCEICGDKWAVPHYHPGKDICDSCKRKGGSVK